MTDNNSTEKGNLGATDHIPRPIKDDENAVVKDDYCDRIEDSPDQPGDTDPPTPTRKSKPSLFTTLKRKLTLKRKQEVSVDSAEGVDGRKDAAAGWSRHTFGRRSLRPASRPVTKPFRPARSEERLNTACKSTKSTKSTKSFKFWSKSKPPKLPPRNKPSFSKQYSSNISENSLQEDFVHRNVSRKVLALPGDDTAAGHAPQTPPSGGNIDTTPKEIVRRQGRGSGVDANGKRPRSLLPPRACNSVSGEPQHIVYDQAREILPKWSVTNELFKLSRFGWYWGPVTRQEAQKILRNMPDGSFIVRDSSDHRYLLSLSFRSCDRTLHFRIEQRKGLFSFYIQLEADRFCSMVDLIEHSMRKSQDGVLCHAGGRAHGSMSFPVRLTKPVSRFNKVRSLQYLCRFVIRLYIRIDHIQKLPLPTIIKGWLEENQY